jgi:metal-responsive CopG/Arc/MetJ family transcriptional regulator
MVKKDFMLRVRMDEKTVQQLDTLAATTAAGNRSEAIRQLVNQAANSQQQTGPKAPAKP